MLKVSLIAMFAAIMATFAVTASTLPPAPGIAGATVAVAALD